MKTAIGKNSMGNIFSRYIFVIVASLTLLFSSEIIAQKEIGNQPGISRQENRQKEGLPTDQTEVQERKKTEQTSLQDKVLLQQKEGQKTEGTGTGAETGAGARVGTGAGTGVGTGTKAEIKEEEAVALVHFHSEVRIVLGDGRNLNGRLTLKTPAEMTIHHSLSGVKYQKVIRMKDISSISFRSWQGEKLRQNKVGQVYRFNVASYAIALKSGQALAVKGEIFPFLKEFQLNNANGTVKLFSFWMDLYKKDGSWYTNISGPQDGRRLTCHRDVVKSISFTNVDTSNR